MDDLKDSIRKYVEERISGPLFGYLFISWIGYNWKGLAVLFLDKRPIVERIQYLSETPTVSWVFWAPLLIGLALAVSAPYLNLGLQKIHFWASLLKEKDLEGLSLRNIRHEKLLVKERVQLKSAEAYEEARQQIRLSLSNARKAKVDVGIDYYEKIALSLNLKNEDIKRENKRLYGYREEVAKLIDAYITEMTLGAGVNNVEEFKTRLHYINNLRGQLQGIKNESKIWDDLGTNGKTRIPH